MIAQFFGQQIDAIFFVSGLAFLVLFVVCLNLVQEQRERLPWIYMMVFALVQGINHLVECLVYSFGQNLIISIIRLIFNIVSFVSLLEFGRVGLERLTGKSPNRWIHIPLLICASLGGLSGGTTGLEVTILYVYGFISGLCVGFILHRAAKIQKSKSLTFAALLLFGYAFMAGLFVPKADFFPASLINRDAFFNMIGVPAEFFMVGLVLIFSLVLWKYYQKEKPPILSADGHKPKNFFETQFVLLFAIFVISGWGLAEYAGNLANQSIHTDLLNHVNLTKNAIAVNQLKILGASGSDENLPSYVSLRQKLVDIKNSDLRFHDVYLMLLKDQWIYFAVDSLPKIDSDFRIPGRFFQSPPEKLFDVFFGTESQVIGPYSDEYGTFISGYAPIRDELTDKVIGVLGIDINFTDIQRIIAQYRLVTFAFTLLAFIIFIGFFSFRERTWESAQRIAASQKSLAQAQTIAQIGSWTWSLVSNRFSWSEEMYRIFGRAMDERVDSFSIFQEFFTSEEWKIFNAAVQIAILDGQEFELESRIIRTDKTQRIIFTRVKPQIGSDGKVSLLLGISQDITERKNSDEKIRNLSRAIEQSPISVVITNPNGQIEYVNPKFSHLTGYSIEEAIGQNPRILKSGETTGDEYSKLWKTIQSGREWIGEFHNKKKNGELYWENAIISPILDGNGKITHYVAVKEDITERKQAGIELLRTHAELEKTNLELAKASKVKSQFLANMSHEIRTPLNAIIGMTGLLLDTPLVTEQHNYAETVRTSGELLLTLINDILDFSKIEADKMELENQAFNLRQCIEEALDLIATKAAQKKLELAYLIKDDLPVFMIGDITRLRQILVNLLGNAVKFTDMGEVVVSVNGQLRDQHQYQLHFAIRDTGLGIPPDRLDRLFQSFSQVDTSTTRRFGGTGLGLAISKQLSELMGGTMWVESTGIPGEGTTFHFTILVKEAPDQEQFEKNHREPVDLTGLRILIVDDNSTNREILLHYAESWKMVPTAVKSGREALELLENNESFDLAILDFMMPEMDGVSLANEIRQLLQQNTFPLILLSSLGYREAQKEETCFNAYLTKPIKPSQLYDVLATTFNGNSAPIKMRFSSTSITLDRELGLHHPLRVLVVEDNTVNQTVALSMLGKIGYRADVANNGIEALEALDRQSYDIVFMDGQMPEMDGEEATIQIREQLPPHQQPFIVAMTANAMQGDRERYLSYGMNDYISKPIRMEDLVRALTNAQPLQLHSFNETEPPEESGDRVAQTFDNHTDISLTSIETIVTANQSEGIHPAAINPRVLQELQDMMGDDGQEMVANLIGLYLNNAEVLMESMQRAHFAADCDTLRRDAHTFKGNSSQMGAEFLASLCSELEKLAKANSTMGVQDWINQIRTEYNRVKSGLNLIANKPGLFLE